MLPGYIQRLEEMEALLRCSPTAAEHLAQLVSHVTPPGARAWRPMTLFLSQDSSLAQLLARVVEVEGLSDQVLCWQEGCSRRSDDGTG